MTTVRDLQKQLFFRVVVVQKVGNNTKLQNAFEVNLSLKKVEDHGELIKRPSLLKEHQLQAVTSLEFFVYFFVVFCCCFVIVAVASCFVHFQCLIFC